MKNTAAYTNLAGWFEYLNDYCDYENWSQYLIMKLSRFPLTAGLDVGCGGGWFTRAFQKHGYAMTGLDISAEMLDFAQETAMKSGLRCEYLLGDISKMKLPQRFDFVTAINDCVNYIPKDRLAASFKNIRAALKKEGVFLFDISSPRKFKEKIANTVSVDDRDDVTYFSFNREETDGVTMEVTLFTKRADGAFDRLDETHRQYVYTEEELLVLLDATGFTVLETEGHLGADKGSADRITFLCQRKG
jgi:SAM-dependent methyltransferase